MKYILVLAWFFVGCAVAEDAQFTQEKVYLTSGKHHVKNRIFVKITVENTSFCWSDTMFGSTAQAVTIDCQIFEAAKRVSEKSKKR